MGEDGLDNQNNLRHGGAYYKARDKKGDEVYGIAHASGRTHMSLRVGDGIAKNDIGLHTLEE